MARKSADAEDASMEIEDQIAVTKTIRIPKRLERLLGKEKNPDEFIARALDAWFAERGNLTARGSAKSG